jgi:homoserine O-succinyltransferase/O-acetyltransferase
MTLLFDKQHTIASPALAPAVGDIAPDGAGRSDLVIGLINNMPDGALKATERQFQSVVHAASGKLRIQFHCFTLPSVPRSGLARRHVDSAYRDIADLGSLRIDGLIVTGAEPNAARLHDEPYWGELTDIVEWAKTNTRTTIWSCLAAHAAVLHLDGIKRHRLGAKCAGVYDCTTVSYDWLTNGAPRTMQISHSRHNELRESELAGHGYQVLTRSAQAGVDIFAKQFSSRFIFFQGHPEYDALSLQREYMRDIARFLSRERDDYPRLPANYFDAATEDVLDRFEARARSLREPTLAAELPGLALRPDMAAGAAASVLFRNWISFLRQGRTAQLPGRSMPDHHPRR